jgi:hypothetical protein
VQKNRKEKNERKKKEKEGGSSIDWVMGPSK